MLASSSQFHRFVTRLHRRHLALHLIEQAGLGLAIGGALAVGAIALASLFSRPALAPVIICFSLGLLGGLITGWLRRPDILASTIEADRQLRLADLLSTAWTLSPSPDHWKTTLLAMAEHRCRDLSPSQVVLKRWGGRAWGGLAIATGLVLTLALVIEHSSPSQASVTTTDLFSRPAAPETPRPPAPSVAERSQTAIPVRQRHVDDTEDDTSQHPETSDSATATNSATPNVTHDNKTPSASETPGAGMAKSNPTPQLLHMTTDTPRQPSMADGRHALPANGGSGGHAEGSSPIPGSQTAGGTRAPPTTPNASSPTPPTDQPANLSTVAAEPQYAPYRNLIRAYFDRQENRD